MIYSSVSVGIDSVKKQQCDTFKAQRCERIWFNPHTESDSVSCSCDKNCRFCSFKIMTVECRPPLCVWCIRMDLKMNFKESVYLQHISVYLRDTMLHITKPLFLKNEVNFPNRVCNTWRKLSTGSCLADACSPESMWPVCCHLYLLNKNHRKMKNTTLQINWTMATKCIII